MRRLRPAPPIESLRDELDAAGAHVAVVDGLAVRDKASAIAAVVTAIGSPDWVGRNLDGLSDALRDRSWWPVGPLALVWPHADRLWLIPPRDRTAVLAVLADAIEQSPADRDFSVWLLDSPPEV